MVMNGAAREGFGVEMPLHPAPELGALIPQSFDDQFQRTVARCLRNTEMEIAIGLLAYREIVNVRGHAHDRLPQFLEIFGLCHDGRVLLGRHPTGRRPGN